MELLSNEQLRERYQQIKDNPYLIRYLSEPVAVQLYAAVNSGVDKFINEHQENFCKLSFYKEHITLLVELKIHIDKLTRKPKQNTFIDKIYLLHFYNHFKSFFPDETKKSWFQRFVYPCQTPIDPIKIESEVKGENNRLILLTVLAAIWEHPHPNFVYNDFVLNRFGIKNFQKAKSYWKDDKNYTENLRTCRQMLKPDIF